MNTTPQDEGTLNNPNTPIDLGPSLAMELWRKRGEVDYDDQFCSINDASIPPFLIFTFYSEGEEYMLSCSDLNNTTTGPLHLRESRYTWEYASDKTFIRIHQEGQPTMILMGDSNLYGQKPIKDADSVLKAMNRELEKYRLGLIKLSMDAIFLMKT